MVHQEATGACQLLIKLDERGKCTLLKAGVQVTHGTNFMGSSDMQKQVICTKQYGVGNSYV